MKRIVFLTATLLFCLTACSQKKSVSELLEGTWQNVDDKSNYLVFENGMRKEIVAGMDDWDVEAYTLSDFCTNETDKEKELSGEKEKYISCNESDLCWYINQLDKENLVVTYTGRGNSLSYKRVEKAVSPAISDADCEDFETFLNRYNADFEFQESRTIFPFISEIIEYEEVMNDENEVEYKEKKIVTETSENEWEKMDFTWDPSYAERETDAFTQEIETVGDTTFIYYKGVENGINVQIVFVCKNKQWYLQKIINNSM